MGWLRLWRIIYMQYKYEMLSISYKKPYSGLCCFFTCSTYSRLPITRIEPCRKIEKSSSYPRELEANNRNMEISKRMGRECKYYAHLTSRETRYIQSLTWLIYWGGDWFLNRSDEKVKTKIGTKNSCFDCFFCICFSCFVFFSVSNFSTLFFSICDALNTCFESSRVELYWNDLKAKTAKIISS